MKFVRGAGIALVCLIIVGLLAERAARWWAPRVNPPAGELVDLGNRRLHLDCIGAGSPAVVFEAGAGSPSIVWRRTQWMLADSVRVCSYDRAGIGWSDRARGSRDADPLVADLHALLSAASIPPPYILVGHSLGGPLIAAYAQRHPSDVTGLVFVDPTPLGPTMGQLESRGLLVRFLTLGTRIAAETGAMRLALSLSSGTDDISLYTKSFGSRDLSTLSRELRFMDDILKEAWEAEPSFGDLPIIVLSGGRSPGASPLGSSSDELRSLHESFIAEHAELARRSLRGEHRVIPNAGHYVQLEQPATVTKAILDVLEISRTTANRDVSAPSGGR